MDGGLLLGVRRQSPFLLPAGSLLTIRHLGIPWRSGISSEKIEDRFDTDACSHDCNGQTHKYITGGCEDSRVNQGDSQ